MLDQRRTTNILLLIIVVPLVFYLLKILSFIFIPLIFSMFIALLFLPLMRWLGRRKIPKFISIIIVLLLVAGGLKLGVELVQLSSKEILATKSEFLPKAEEKIADLKVYLTDNFGMEFEQNKNFLAQFFQKENIGSTIGFLRKFLTTLLMTAFFVVLWLAESINVHKILNSTLLKQKYTSVKTFMKIEKDLIKFIKVKVLVSALTGLFTGLMCVFFDVSFPIFWGLFAFAINFVQMVGSFISVILLSIFAFVELDPTSTLFFFCTFYYYGSSGVWCDFRASFYGKIIFNKYNCCTSDANVLGFSLGNSRFNNGNTYHCFYQNYSRTISKY